MNAVKVEKVTNFMQKHESKYQNVNYVPDMKFDSSWTNESSNILFEK